MKNTNDEFLRKRKERQARIRKRRLIISFAIVIILLLIVGVILSLTVLFPISELSASGSKVYTNKQIITASQINNGDNIFSLSEKDTLKTLKSKLPFIESIKFKRTLPDKLEIIVTDAKEYACYQYKGKYYTVSQDGWVLKEYIEIPQNAFYIICNDVKCKVGSEVEFSKDSTHELSEQIGDLLTKYKISVNYIDITNEIVLKAKVENRFVVNFGTSSNLENKVKHLYTMMQKIEENKTGNINLSMWNSQNTQGTFVETDIK